ncbi:oxygen-independent coproporphyrinogen III oxidase [Rhodohalobacter mucosus]|uniref:Coproporphyrinogen-III oxidase n=1 Tax=Rhodohalobacter mucosus TaxID=2079485 RepID=A0A316TYN5_9BACT|nr:oxygen-independent coproporphyrinogen III oxidase [Rhodohalobacter mucosus]PWN07982.1 oxygen-independent coproporphyrinogen III oxidase [Rhodohalobacter mucosus]
MNTRENSLAALIARYNVPGPRYTSYPTALQFTDRFSRTSFEGLLLERVSRKRKLSLYFHIPFCFSLCWYCGCTKVITRDQDRGDVYLDYLEKEALLVSATLHPDSVVEQIHFGGGTPTFLNPDQLKKLGGIIRRYFQLSDTAEFSVEIDPRRCTRDHIDALALIGMNRASLGVQDTNEDVQKAIHRIQPLEQTAEVTGWLRDAGVTGINYDLIYGLPRQTADTFSQTIDDVVALSPDRFAVYSYAHIPSVMPAQKLLNENEFPSADEKLNMLVHAIQSLPEMGYRFIGMDHFALETDELSRALDEGSLHRNFQGYSTKAELEMIALGMSGISQGEALYYQNEKDLGRYYKALDEGLLPVAKVLRLSEEDKVRKEMIMDIMCRGELIYDDYLNRSDKVLMSIMDGNRDAFEELSRDGLILQTGERILVTDRGRLFLRNVAMLFDGYIHSDMSQSGIRYSKTV